VVGGGLGQTDVLANLGNTLQKRIPERLLRWTAAGVLPSGCRPDGLLFHPAQRAASSPGSRRVAAGPEGGLKKENFGSAGSNITYRIEANAAARWLVAMRSAR
jgi:hypothetical protein